MKKLLFITLFLTWQIKAYAQIINLDEEATYNAKLLSTVGVSFYAFMRNPMYSSQLYVAFTSLFYTYLLRPGQNKEAIEQEFNLELDRYVSEGVATPAIKNFLSIISHLNPELSEEEIKYFVINNRQNLPK